VPCPTAMLTIGALLLAFSRPPVQLIIVPIIWTIIGGSAAILLRVPADFALLLAGFALLVATLPQIQQRRRGQVRVRIPGGRKSVT
jgi:uncharacterized membrane protein YccC